MLVPSPLSFFFVRERAVITNRGNNSGVERSSSTREDPQVGRANRFTYGHLPVYFSECCICMSRC